MRLQELNKLVSNLLRLKQFFFILTFGVFLASCADSGSSSNPGGQAPNTPFQKLPTTQERPKVPTYSKYEILGPNNEQVIVPDGANLSETQVQISESTEKDLLSKQENSVSKSIKINIMGDHSLHSDKSVLVNIPLTKKVDNPSHLIAKVKLSTGAVFPVLGAYLPNTNTYQVPLASVSNNWSLTVAINNNLKNTSSKSNPFSILGWLTEMTWETCNWTAVIHNDMTQADVDTKVLPEAVDACQTLQNLGLRSPRLWVIDNNQQKSRVLHVIDGGSYYSSNPLDENNNYLSNATEEEMLALGQMYISYKQFEDLKAKYGISLGNIIIHELLHSSQNGYDIRYGRQDKITSLKAYYEGTATPLGQTYQEFQSISGPDVAARDLREGEHMMLDSAVDDPWADYYTKQSFFAFVAKRYNNGSFSYTHQLFEQLAMSAYGMNNQPVNDYLPKYREGMDRAFQSELNKTLQDVYFEFAEERAFIHKDTIHKIDNTFKPYTLAHELFKQETQDIDYLITNNTTVNYEGISPLSTKVMKVILPADLCSGDCPSEYGIDVRLKAVGVEQKDFKVVSFAIDPATQNYIQGSRKEIKDFYNPIRFSSPRGQMRMYIVLIMNASLADAKLDFTASSGAMIDYTLQTDVQTGDIIRINGSGFGDTQGDAQVLWDNRQLKVISWSNNLIEVEVTPDLPTKKSKLYVKFRNSETNKIEINIRNSRLSEYFLFMSFDSKAISIGNIKMPINVSNGIVSFDYSQGGVDNGSTYEVTIKGKGTFDGKEIHISGGISVNTYSEFKSGEDITITTEEETMSFTDASGRWSMNIFFPGKTKSSSAHYIYDVKNPKADPVHYEVDFDPDIQIWEWANN